MEEETRKRDEAQAELLRAIDGLREKLNQVERLYAMQKGGGSNPPSRSTDLQEDQDTAVALAELLTEGLIEFSNDEEMRLTDDGIDYAWGIYHTHTPKDMVALALLWERMHYYEEDDEEGTAPG